MKNKQLLELVSNLNQVIGNQETKVAKKLFKIFEKIKPLYEKYNADVEELRLDNASTDKDGILLLDEKSNYKYSKEGIKKLTQQVKDLSEKEIEFNKIEVINTSGLEDFSFLQDWTTGIEFNKQEEEEL
jgi:hypothetical protein